MSRRGEWARPPQVSAADTLRAPDSNQIFALARGVGLKFCESRRSSHLAPPLAGPTQRAPLARPPAAWLTGAIRLHWRAPLGARVAGETIVTGWLAGVDTISAPLAGPLFAPGGPVGRIVVLADCGGRERGREWPSRQPAANDGKSAADWEQAAGKSLRSLRLQLAARISIPLLSEMKPARAKHQPLNPSAG